MNERIRLSEIDNEQHFKYESNCVVVQSFTANPLPAVWSRGFLFKTKVGARQLGLMVLTQTNYTSSCLALTQLFPKRREPGWESTEPSPLIWPFKHDSKHTARLSGLTPSRSFVRGFFVENNRFVPTQEVKND